MNYEIYQDEKKEWRWRLKANNGKIIADSAEGYKDAIDCQRGIELVQSSHSAKIAFVV